MGLRFAVIGSGMQGTAGGYDLAHFGAADQVIMADVSEARAQQAAQKINQLTGKKTAVARKVDARSKADLIKLAGEVDGILSATSYELNLSITEAAIEGSAHLVDLGGNTDVVFSQMKLSEKAKEKSLSIVPDCGLAPGLGNTLAALAISQFDQADKVQIRCGGLPQKPRGPLDYKLVFSVRGLTNEYFGKAWIIQDGKRVCVDTFQDVEALEFPAPVGKCEAFPTSGGTSTVPWTFEGKVKNLDYRTVRYPGHYAKMKCILDLGLLDLDPVEIDGSRVIPREIFHKIVPEKIAYPEDHDLVVLRVNAEGIKNGKKASVTYDLMDFQDPRTGFSAMERTTAFPAALVLLHAARGQAQRGVVALETALDNQAYFDELLTHGMSIKTIRG
jgi:lysine 6-dehydrogenase